MAAVWVQLPVAWPWRGGTCYRSHPAHVRPESREQGEVAVGQEAAQPWQAQAQAKPFSCMA